MVWRWASQEWSCDTANRLYCFSEGLGGGSGRRVMILSLSKHLMILLLARQLPKKFKSLFKETYLEALRGVRIFVLAWLSTLSLKLELKGDFIYGDGFDVRINNKVFADLCSISKLAVVCIFNRGPFIGASWKRII